MVGAGECRPVRRNQRGCLRRRGRYATPV